MYPFPGNVTKKIRSFRVSFHRVGIPTLRRRLPHQSADWFAMTAMIVTLLILKFIFSRRNFAISEGVGGFSGCRRLLCCVAFFKAEKNQTPTGFHGHLAANTAQNPLKIPTGIPFGILLVLAAIYTVKTQTKRL